jgi:hypothetical protein
MTFTYFTVKTSRVVISRYIMFLLLLWTGHIITPGCSSVTDYLYVVTKGVLLNDQSCMGVLTAFNGSPPPEGLRTVTGCIMTKGYPPTERLWVVTVGRVNRGFPPPGL